MSCRPRCLTNAVNGALTSNKNGLEIAIVFRVQSAALLHHATISIGLPGKVALIRARVRR